MNTSRVMIPALLAAALIGGTMTSDAFAGPHHRGQGNGYGPCYGYGDGGCWEGGWGHHGHARGWGYRAMSDAQRAKFDKIMEEFAPRMEQLRDSIYVKRQELRALENATNPDVKAVREAATEMTRLRNEMADLHDALGDKLAAEVGVPEGFKDAPRGPRGPRGPLGRHAFMCVPKGNAEVLYRHTKEIMGDLLIEILYSDKEMGENLMASVESACSDIKEAAKQFLGEE